MSHSAQSQARALKRLPEKEMTPTITHRPWTGIGADLTPGGSMQQHLQEAGLDFVVKRSSVQYLVEHLAGHPGPKEHPTREVLFRSDTKAPLGIMSKGYKVHQTVEVMSFFHEIADAADFKLDTAGSLDGGAKIWALAKVGPEANVIGRDSAAPFLLLATSFDGSLSTTAQFMVGRFACWNMLRRSAVKVRHNQALDRAKLREALGISLTSWETWLKSARRMAVAPLPGVAADAFLVDLLRNKQEAEQVRESTTYRDIMALFEGAALGSALTEGRTHWQMFNAVTEFVDHRRGTSTDSRMNSAWLGKGSQLKTRAYALLSDA